MITLNLIKPKHLKIQYCLLTRICMAAKMHTHFTPSNEHNETGMITNPLARYTLFTNNDEKERTDEIRAKCE